MKKKESTITINDQSVSDFLDAEKTKEVKSFVRDESYIPLHRHISAKYDDDMFKLTPRKIKENSGELIQISGEDLEALNRKSICITRKTSRDLEVFMSMKNLVWLRKFAREVGFSPGAMYREEIEQKIIEAYKKSRFNWRAVASKIPGGDLKYPDPDSKGYFKTSLSEGELTKNDVMNHIIFLMNKIGVTKIDIDLG